MEEARATLQAMLLYTLQCRKTLAEIKVAVPGFSIDAIVVERMAAVCAMALGAVMSGMGDLKTFKLLRCAPRYIARTILWFQLPVERGCVCTDALGISPGTALCFHRCDGHEVPAGRLKRGAE